MAAKWRLSRGYRRASRTEGHLEVYPRCGDSEQIAVHPRGILDGNPFEEEPPEEDRDAHLTHNNKVWMIRAHLNRDESSGIEIQ